MLCKKMALSALLVALAFTAGGTAEAADGNAAELVKKMIEGDAAERDSAERKLREMGAAAVQPLRDAKPGGEEAAARVRNLLSDIALNTAKIDPVDAAMLHEIARDEGKAKRYSNAEKLYRRAEQIYDKLKDDSNTLKDRAKVQQFEDKRRICDRMKDKAARKLKGQSHTGVNLGFVRVGKDHDMSDDWE